MTFEAHSSLEGRTLDGRIEIVRKIGRGGFGSIYEARHKLLGRTVALKVIETEEPSARDRLRTEAQAIAQIQSPHVVALIDFGFDEALRLPYLVMELVNGVPLNELPRPMPWREAAGIAVQLLSGVEAAHSSGVVHRDLKPSNLLIASRKSGEKLVKVLDFGVSRLLFLDARITRTGELIGTPAYMAPEQIQSEEIDGRVDIWSAGVILYELLAGRRPFEANEPIATFRKIVSEEPPPLESVAPSAAPLAPIVLRALAKDRDHRFASAEEMKSEIVALMTERGRLGGSSRARLDRADGCVNVGGVGGVQKTGLDPWWSMSTQ